MISGFPVLNQSCIQEHPTTLWLFLRRSHLDRLGHGRRAGNFEAQRPRNAKTKQVSRSSVWAWVEGHDTCGTSVLVMEPFGAEFSFLAHQRQDSTMHKANYASNREATIHKPRVVVPVRVSAASCRAVTCCHSRPFFSRRLLRRRSISLV